MGKLFNFPLRLAVKRDEEWDCASKSGGFVSIFPTGDMTPDFLHSLGQLRTCGAPEKQHLKVRFPDVSAASSVEFALQTLGLRLMVACGFGSEAVLPASPRQCRVPRRRFTCARRLLLGANFPSEREQDQTRSEQDGGPWLGDQP